MTKDEMKAAIASKMQELAEKKAVPPQVTVTPPDSKKPTRNDVIVRNGVQRYLVLDRTDLIRMVETIKSNETMIPTLRIDLRDCYLTWLTIRPQDKLEKSDA